MRFLHPLTAALVLLIILPGFSFYFDITPKVVILLLGTACSLLFWNGTLPTGRIPILLALQGAWLAITTALSTNPALSAHGGNWRRFGLISYLAVLAYSLLVMVDCARKADRSLWMIRAVVLAGIPISLYGIAQYFGVDPWLAAASYHAGEGPFTIVRPPSTLGHANYFGIYLVYAIFLACSLWTGTASRLWKALAIAAAAIAGLAVLVSGTRAALVGLLVGGTVLLLRTPRLRFKPLLQTSVIATAVLIALLLSPAGAGLRSRIHWSLQEPLGGARPLLWRDSLRMASTRPLIGFGPETFGSEFPRFQSVELARLFPDFQHESAHNVFLDALTAQGIPGLLLFAAIAFVALHTALTTESIALGAALAGGLAAQQFNVFTLPTALCFYLVIALIGAHSPCRQIRWTRSVAIAFALICLAFSTHLVFMDRHLALARDSLTRDDLQSALAHFEQANQWYPHGSSADLYESRELANLFRRTADVRVKLQTWPAAFQAATRAAGSAEDRPNAFYNLAIFFATQNDAPNVERSLRNAILLAPNWFKPHWALARLLLSQRRLPDAETEANLALDLNGGKDAEVVRTYTDVRSAAGK